MALQQFAEAREGVCPCRSKAPGLARLRAIRFACLPTGNGRFRSRVSDRVQGFGSRSFCDSFSTGNYGLRDVTRLSRRIGVRKGLSLRALDQDYSCSKGWERCAGSEDRCSIVWVLWR
jgi:hypothetical protein